MFETVMMGLRLKAGISLSAFQDRYGISFSEAFGGKAAALLRKGVLVAEGDMLRCAGDHYHLLNSVLSDLL